MFLFPPQIDLFLPRTFVFPIRLSLVCGGRLIPTERISNKTPCKKYLYRNTIMGIWRLVLNFDEFHTNTSTFSLSLSFPPLFFFFLTPCTSHFRKTNKKQQFIEKHSTTSCPFYCCKRSKAISFLGFECAQLLVRSYSVKINWYSTSEIAWNLWISLDMPFVWHSCPFSLFVCQYLCCICNG